MPESMLVPSIENRLSMLIEFNRRKDVEAESRRAQKPKPTITISREFGCEAYPMVDHLREILEKKTGEKWLLMDKALLDEVARNHNLSEQVMHGLGEGSRYADEFLATFSSHWKSQKDYFRLLCRHIISLAEQGNVILMGRGSAYITGAMKNCHHFRLFASPAFKVRSIKRRLGVGEEEAERVIHQKQKQRDNFIRDFLDRDAHDIGVFHLVLNNDRSTPEKMARTIADYVLG